jgi:hypothetical protein
MTLTVTKMVTSSNKVLINILADRQLDTSIRGVSLFLSIHVIIFYLP